MNSIRKFWEGFCGTFEDTLDRYSAHDFYGGALYSAFLFLSLFLRSRLFVVVVGAYALITFSLNIAFFFVMKRREERASRLREWVRDTSDDNCDCEECSKEKHPAGDEHS